MAEHYADITPATATYRVYLDDALVAESSDVLELVEHKNGASFPMVPYFASSVLDALDIEMTDTSTICPLKGAASYWSVNGVADGVWSYTEPKSDVSAIAGRVSFDKRKGFRVERVG